MSKRTVRWLMWACFFVLSVGVVRADSPVLSEHLSGLGGVISGYVMDGEKNNTPLANVVVEFRRVRNENPFLTRRTDPGGYYKSAALRPGTYVVRMWAANYMEALFDRVVVVKEKNTMQNANLLLIPKGKVSYRITMSWCNARAGAVRDVDSYLQIPGVSTDAPLSFQRTKTDYYGTHLDVDETKWRGPETVTIKTLREGTYIYYVNNYSHRIEKSALGMSDVQIQVYQGNNHVRTYGIQGGEGITYEVFRIVDGHIVDVKAYNGSLKVYGQIP